MFKKVAILSFFSAFSLWLNGALRMEPFKITDLSSFRYQGINIIWVFDKVNKKWKVYALGYLSER